MGQSEKRYPGKLLLFGEYTVIVGSSALAIPLSKYSGKWSYNHAIDNQNLKDFAGFLSKFSQNHIAQFDTQQFFTDLQRGLYFESNIPQGYGAGSSGALCAAILDVYAINKSDFEKDIEKLKAIFVEMESYFHGTSSGLDPLVSYLNVPIYYKKDSYIKTIEIDHDFEQVFLLIDTHIQRQTAPFVEIFLEKMKDTFFQNIVESLGEVNEKAITAYLNNDVKLLKKFILEIGQYQYQYFKEMIPNDYLFEWNDGIVGGGDRMLKLCGAGGGGFILGFNGEISE